MMRINRPFPTLLLVVLLVMTMPRPAAADDHKADWSGGFSGAFASRLFGARTTLAFNPKRDRTFSIVADLSVHHSKHDNETITRTTNLYGVRLLAFSSADGAVAKHAVSVQLLMGVLSRDRETTKRPRALSASCMPTCPTTVAWDSVGRSITSCHSTPPRSPGCLPASCTGSADSRTAQVTSWRPGPARRRHLARA
jgi:hypothetical protein